MRLIFVLFMFLSLTSCSSKEPGVFFCSNKAYVYFPDFDRFKLALNLSNRTYYTDDVGGKIETVSNTEHVAIVRPFLLSLPRSLGNSNAKWEIAGHQFTQISTKDKTVIRSKANPNINPLTAAFIDTIAVLDLKGNVKEINILQLRDGKIETDKWFGCGTRHLNWETINVVTKRGQIIDSIKNQSN